jgi:hypothetical protein
MTELLPEFATIGALDGELIAFGRDRLPSFERIRRRMLQRDRSVPFALVLFDVLALDGEPVDRLPYLERRDPRIALVLSGRASLSALRRRAGAVERCSRASPRGSRSEAPFGAVPSGREVVGIKRQNPAWPRYAAEREAAVRDRQRKR